MGTASPVPAASPIGAAAAGAGLNMSDPDSFDRFSDNLRENGGAVNAVDIPTSPGDMPGIGYDTGEDPIEVEGSFVDPNTEANGYRSIDQLMEDYIRAQMEAANNVDTTAGEALIREQMDANIGSGRVNNRAAMGAGGWGQSGMAAAVGSDIERAARQQAEQSILGLRQSEAQRAQDNAARAFGLDIEGQQAANEEMMLEAKLAFLQNLMGGGGSDSDGDGIPDDEDPDADGDGRTDDAPEGGSTGPEAQERTDGIVSTAEEVTEQPEGTTLAGSRDGWTIYRDADGNYFKVRQD
jgi:hypothetical protein